MKLARNDELRIIEDVYLAIGFPWGSKFVDEAKKAKKNEKGDYK